MRSYVPSYLAKENSPLVNYVTWRWNLFNLLGSEMFSAFWGSLVAWSIRLIPHFLLQTPFYFSLGCNMFKVTEFWVIIVISLGSFILFFLV